MKKKSKKFKKSKKEKKFVDDDSFDDEDEKTGERKSITKVAGDEQPKSRKKHKADKSLSTHEEKNGGVESCSDWIVLFMMGSKPKAMRKALDSASTLVDTTQRSSG